MHFAINGTETIVARESMLFRNTKDPIVKFFLKCTNRCEEWPNLPLHNIRSHISLMLQRASTHRCRVFNFLCRSPFFEGEYETQQADGLSFLARERYQPQDPRQDEQRFSFTESLLGSLNHRHENGGA
jgi:hypothetical protein